MLKTSEFINPRTKSISFRVYGRVGGKTIRKNFSSALEAENWAFIENGKLADKKAASITNPRHAVLTTLAPDELTAAEAMRDEMAGRATLKEILQAGKRALEVSPVAKPVAQLVEEWLGLIKADTGANWYRDLRARCRRFSKDNPNALTSDLTQPMVSGWLTGMKLSRVSRAHFRGALSRFFGWLV